MKMTSTDGRATLMVGDSAKTLKRLYFLQRECVLAQAGWTPRSDINQDHDVPGLPVDERARQKWFLREPPGSRRVNIHVRVMGHANQRYPLLFRDYLRADEPARDKYASAKRAAAAVWADDGIAYTDAKTTVILELLEAAKLCSATRE